VTGTLSVLHLRKSASLRHSVCFCCSYHFINIPTWTECIFYNIKEICYGFHRRNSRGNPPPPPLKPKPGKFFRAPRDLDYLKVTDPHAPHPHPPAVSLSLFPSFRPCRCQGQQEKGGRGWRGGGGALGSSMTPSHANMPNCKTILVYSVKPKFRTEQSHCPSYVLHIAWKVQTTTCMQKPRKRVNCRNNTANVDSGKEVLTAHRMPYSRKQVSRIINETSAICNKKRSRHWAQ
jgi:hypothetical protein